MSVQPPKDKAGRLASAYLVWNDASGATQIFVPDLVESEEWSGGSTVTEHPVEVGANITDNVRVGLRKVTLKIFATNEPIDSNQWANAAMGPATVNVPSVTWGPTPSLLDVPEWRNNLELRALATTAGGAVGSALGGALVGGIGAVGASLVAGAVFPGVVVHVPTKFNIGTPPPPTTPPLTVQVLGFDTPGDFVLQTITLLEGLRKAAQTIDVIGTKDSCVGLGTPGSLGAMAITDLTHVEGFEEGTGASITITLQELRTVSTTTVPAPKPSLPRAAAPVNKGNQQTGELGGAAAAAADAFAKGFHQGSADVQALAGH